MGEVYLAVDTSLGREVAIKLLPDAFVSDPERLARFHREARVLASLSHSGIAVIHALEEAEGMHLLVMELVPGPTLADRIASGPLPLNEALGIAGQIAEALESAHAKGIIHRDLKPANVKIAPDGKVKVLDFGLAKAMAGPDRAADLSLSPTVTSANTGTGVILGTVSYMSPEQARGQELDQRTDVFSFGCVLYEMITGRRAFPGGTISDTLAALLKSEPDLEALPPGTPPGIRRLLRRCLAKDTAHRLRHIGDAHLEIDEALAGTEPDTGTAPAGEAAR
ncbi:MAG TPA: serine/threonine-protein kinase, partial [Candidatus Saccharimonadales bacterium]|nr:serine/threonine-protein kinase [Candidatus Saccharimonadales bacterium]